MHDGQLWYTDETSCEVDTKGFMGVLAADDNSPFNSDFCEKINGNTCISKLVSIKITCRGLEMSCLWSNF